jgi:large subunit ribosomal protein L22
MYKYATQNMTDKMAKAVKTSVAISTKQSVEIAKWLKGRTPAAALKLLSNVVEQKQAVPFTRFNWNMGHKPGIGPGRFPKKAAAEFISLVKLAVANATDKGLDTDSLVIFNIVAQKGGKQYKPNRIRGQKAKRTHIELVVEEKIAKASKKAGAKSSQAKPKEIEATAQVADEVESDTQNTADEKPKKTAVKKKKAKDVDASEVAE